MVDSLRFNVAQLLRDPVGTSRHADVAADLGALALELGEAAAAQRLTGSIRLMHTHAGVLVQGRLAAEATFPCARCLEPVVVPLKIELEEVFAPTVDIGTGKSLTPEEEDRALWIDEHHILDLTEVLRQDVLLTAPMTALCKEDCRGLCPTCGQNLNDGACGCEPEPDPRWGPLVDLLNRTRSQS